MTPTPGQHFPQTLYVADSSLVTSEEPWTEAEDDPRGLVLMWEAPSRHAKYIMGVDPTEGITGWSRATRTEGDDKIDNGAIEIFRVDGDFELMFKDYKGVRIPDYEPGSKRQKRRWKDVQVCEFAGPVDAVEIARIANALGRIYAGEEEDSCELIWEAWPGPGLLTTQELLRLGYGNLWMWEYIDAVAEETNRPGWRSTPTSQRMLWYRSRRHLMGGHAVIRSPWLRGELSTAEIDITKMRAKAAHGYHDDRMQAASMCFWAGHKWTYDTDRIEIPVLESMASGEQDYQRMAPTMDSRGNTEGYTSYADWKADQLAQFEE